jgi:hypothetical protein
MACGGCCNAVQYWVCTLCCGCLSALTVVSRSVSHDGGNPPLVVFPNPNRHPPRWPYPQSQLQSSIAHRYRLVVLDLDGMFPLPLGVVICNLRKPMPQLARPHQMSCLSGMELSTGVGWFTYVTISYNVAHLFSLFYSLAPTLVVLSIHRLSRYAYISRISLAVFQKSQSSTFAGRPIGSPSR